MRFLLIAALIFTAFVAFAAEKTTEVFTLDHQMSEHCQKRIMDNMRFEKGIDKIDVSLKENTITITYNPKKTDTEKIIAGFKKIGFNAMLVSDTQKEEAKDQGAACCPGNACCGGSSPCCQ